MALLMKKSVLKFILLLHFYAAFNHFLQYQVINKVINILENKSTVIELVSYYFL